jgi:hypothetical protein
MCLRTMTEPAHTENPYLAQLHRRIIDYLNKLAPRPWPGYVFEVTVREEGDTLQFDHRLSNADNAAMQIPIDDRLYDLILQLYEFAMDQDDVWRTVQYRVPDRTGPSPPFAVEFTFS